MKIAFLLLAILVVVSAKHVPSNDDIDCYGLKNEHPLVIMDT